MDNIIVKPFAGQTPGGVGQFFDATSGSKQGKKGFFDYKDVNKSEKGLRRILSPEFRRPILREASFKAGQIARSKLAQQLSRGSVVK